MSDYGIRISKPGYDQVDSDIRNMLFHSDYTMLKYHSDNTAFLTINAGLNYGEVSVSHNLSYVPLYVAYVSYPFYSSYQHMIPNGQIPNPEVVTAYADSTDVVCRVNKIAEGSNRSYTFRVIIFKDRLV